MRLLSAAALAFSLVVGAASASAADVAQPTTGPAYYHRAGADLTLHDKALDYCLAEAATTVQGKRGPTLASGVMFGALGVLVEAAVNESRDGEVQNRGFAANVENCMVATGWSVMVLSQAEAAAFDALPPDGQRQRLAAMVGAAAPEGMLSRRFGNEIVNARARWIVEPEAYGVLPLPLRVRGYADWPAVKAAARPPEYPSLRTPKFPTPAGIPLIAKDQWDKVPEGATVLVIKVKRFVGLRSEPILIFSREGPDPRYPAWFDDGKPDLLTTSFGMGLNVKNKTQTEGIVVIPLPPGRWRLMGVRQGRVITSFCLGAPSFDLVEGQVTYAGQLDYGRTPQFTANTDLSTIDADLDNAPGLRDRLKPARWVNGSRFMCDGSYIYAFEVQGGAYLPGYTNGSAAPSLPPGPSPP
ncbi:hypothetical protein [Caulobacter sp. NIBR1757]|uniref:hypothetical protein n=1 Tax=Caulobacter sp. NIBR1757 TaxID=3016000 RepID=UPI0022F03674|nr:hypothetical protein [Caulobacter sp. NIBR1757]WGM38234.1 hypothetical protein AMEJIAPC_01136 [Caulobacter sp. NIBR1757]